MATGMISCCPTLSRVLVKPLASMMAWTVTPYLAAISYRVSPRATVWMVGVADGAGVVVSDEAIVEAIGELASTTGVFAEPAGAAALAGLRAALAEGLVRADESVVLLVTGTGLKDVPAAARGVRLPDPVVPEIGAVVDCLRVH